MLELDKFIDRKYIFGKGFSQSDGINIAFGIDKNFAFQMGITILSIIDNNRQENLIFNVFANSIFEKDIEKLKIVAEENGVNINIYVINIENAEKITGLKWRAVYNRFFAPLLTDNNNKKVLYLDADIVCLGSLRELFELEFDNNLAMVVEDQGAVDGYIKTLNLQNGKYFNAGMIFIDIEAWNNNKISEQALKMLKDRDLFLLDQDALNVLLDGKLIYLPIKWNQMCNMEKKRTKIYDDTIIVHYASINKPWHSWCFHSARMPWLYYFEKSVWCDEKFWNKPKNYREMRMMAAYKLHCKKYKEFFCWLIKYYKQRKLEKKNKKL